MFTNKYELNLLIQVWLNHDTYDYSTDPYYISATSLLKPTKQIILSKRYQGKLEGDISSFIPSKYGTSIHAGIEEAWLSPKLKDNLLSLGLNKETVERIKINPKEPREEDINVFLEQRSTRKIGKWTIGGKFDLVFDGKLYDNKSTSVWTYLYESKLKDYTCQMSIYRWLNPKLVTDDYFTINYIFTDWSQIKAIQQKDYPKCRIVSKDYKLIDLASIEWFIKSKLNVLEEYWSYPDDKLPRCTDEELWRTPTKYKYYKDPEKRDRATKVFDDLNEANAYWYGKMQSKGIVIPVAGSVRRCAYCPCFNYCKQKDEYIQNGLLEC